MTGMIGRNRNTNDVATVITYEVNPTNAITVAAANSSRIHLSISLDVGLTSRRAFIRLYPASDDNDKKGSLLALELLGNDALVVFNWEMTPDNVYTGPVSMISVAGTFNVHVTEY